MPKLVNIYQDRVRDVEIADPLGENDEIQPSEYRISSYGADYPVQMLVNQLEDGDVFTPPFQRGYVWDVKTASRFVESLLLGLPVPGIFLSLEAESQKYLIIDGQQRLKTLQYFYDGIFLPTNKKFELGGVQSEFRGKGFRDLLPQHKRRLSNSVVHATIIRQESPTDDQSSVFHIFERLNTGGKQLAPQEIRSALFNGPLVDLLRELNEVPAWRAIYGPISPQQRDIELIVRFLAFYFYRTSYAAPMKVFLNRFMGRNRAFQDQGSGDIRKAFVPTIEVIADALGADAFRPSRALNAAVLDSVMDAIAQRISSGERDDPIRIRRAYSKLLTDPEFIEGISRATANEQRVKQRYGAAVRAFSEG